MWVARFALIAVSETMLLERSSYIIKVAFRVVFVLSIDCITVPHNVKVAQWIISCFFLVK